MENKKTKTTITKITTKKKREINPSLKNIGEVLYEMLHASFLSGISHLHADGAVNKVRDQNPQEEQPKKARVYPTELDQARVQDLVYESSWSLGLKLVHLPKKRKTRQNETNKRRCFQKNRESCFSLGF